MNNLKTLLAAALLFTASCSEHECGGLPLPEAKEGSGKGTVFQAVVLKSGERILVGEVISIDGCVVKFSNDITVDWREVAATQE